MTANGYVTPEDDPNLPGGVYIKAFVGHAEGATAGDNIVLLSGGVGGTAVAFAVVTNANGDFGQNYAGKGVYAKTPLYYVEQKTGGTIKTEIVWE